MSHVLVIIYIVSTLLVFAMAPSFTYFCLGNGKKKKPYPISIQMIPPYFTVSYRDLRRATNGFSMTNLVGTGGCGSVYKGVFDDGVFDGGVFHNELFDRIDYGSDSWQDGIRDGNETAIAVKVFNPQRRGAAQSFITERKSLRNIRHRNVANIVTSCSGVDTQGQDFRAIVYEFMEHGSLERWLHLTKNTTHDRLNNPQILKSLERGLHLTKNTNHDGLKQPRILNLSSRFNIAIDVACALDYLHHQCTNPVIHCNLKPSNILLDKKMVAHVTDFGLAKFCPEFQSECQSSLEFRGTIGYAAPEYGYENMVSTKGDVYSYGILLLEMLTGKKPTDPMFHGGLNLHNFVSNALPDRVMDIIDPVILSEFIKDDAAQMTDTNVTSANKENGNQMTGLIILMFNTGVKCTTDLPLVRPQISHVLSVLKEARTIFKVIQLRSTEKKKKRSDDCPTKKAVVEPYLNNSSSQDASLTAMKPMKFITHRRRKKEKPNSRSISMLSSFKVSYEELHKATNGFSSTNLVGAGGFGSVYKGIIDQAYARFDLPYNGMSDGDGTVIAVKVFNLQRRSAVTSFSSECILRNISHKNLVKIITTCTSVDEEGQHFRAIVYEFMEHGSLERWLHPAKKEYHDGLNKPRILNLHTRISIAIDVASALDYLHHQIQEPIIHCDLKPSNILLDRDMNALVADFGLATFLPKSPNNSDQSSSIALRGTSGYIPAEYGLGSMVSTKGDVYSFGILLLEMLTGKKPTHRMFHGGINLHNFAWMALPDGIMDITDPTMKRMVSVDEDHGNQMRECLTKMFNIGVKCSKPSPQVRPDICDVLRELKSLKDIFKEIELQPTSPFKD